MDKKRFTLPNWAAYLINAALFAAFIIGGNAVLSSGALPGFITKVAMLIGIQVIAAVSLNILLLLVHYTSFNYCILQLSH